MQQRHAEHEAEDDAGEQGGDEGPLGRRPTCLLVAQGTQLVLQLSAPGLQMLHIGQLACRTGADLRRGGCFLGLASVPVQLGARASACRGRKGGARGGMTLICVDAIR